MNSGKSEKTPKIALRHSRIGLRMLFIMLAAVSIIPVIFVFMISVSSEASIRLQGYSMWPSEFSGAAYQFLWRERSMIFDALYISVLVTLIGTLLGLALTTTMGYVLSRPNFRLKGLFTWVVLM